MQKQKKKKKKADVSFLPFLIKIVFIVLFIENILFFTVFIKSLPIEKVFAAPSTSFVSPLFSMDVLVTSPTPTPALPLTDSAGDFCLDVPVLMYHHVQPMEMATLLGHPQLTIDSKLFEEHVQFFVENDYNIIAADELIHALINRQQLPPKTLVITIDDGYDDNYTYAFSTAKKFEVIMNFMIPTDLIGRSGYMTWDHLREMSTSPYARLYNHTATHAALGVSSEEVIEQELLSSTVSFKKYLNFVPTIFTYPYGSFSDLAVEKVKEHGFIGAFSTIDGTLQCRSQIMTLPRSRIGNAPLSFYGFGM